MINIPNLPPFKRMCITVGNLPSSFMESMSYYEALCWLVNYLQKEVIPVVNTTSEAVTELQNYVANYFTNLDVQEEINNKLDEMALDGTLQEIISDYLNTKAVFCFDNVEGLKEATNLIDGSYAQTLGYYEKNDDGKALYKIREITNQDVVNEMDIIALNNNLIAELITNELNIKQFGAKGNNLTDNSEIFETAIDYCSERKINLYIPAGTYLLSNELEITNSIIIKGENKNNTIIKQTSLDKSIFIVSANYTTISDIQFYAPADYEENLIKLTTKAFHVWSINIYKCIFNGNNGGNGIGLIPLASASYGLMNTVIEKCDFKNLNAGMFINIKNNSWANCGSIKDCWQYDCVYGILFDENSKGINYWNIINFSGQYNSQISNTHIKNLKGEKNKFDTCILYDGGFGIDLTPEAKRTTIINCKTGYNPIHDLGYLTNIIENGEEEDGTFYELDENFIGTNAFTSSGSTEHTVTIEATGGLPICNISTGDVINNYSIASLNRQLIYGRNLQARQNFGFMLTDITNLKFYLGLELGLDGNFQGTFLKYDSSVDNKLHLIQKGSSSESVNETLITLEANKWYDIQLIRDNRSDKIYLWINNNYVVSIANTLNYNAQPYFRIDTLEAVNKTLMVRNIKCRTFHYN